MAIKSITTTELKYACMNVDWKERWINGKNPPTNTHDIPVGSIAVYGSRFHYIAKKFLDWMVMPKNNNAVLNLFDKYSIWDKMYTKFAEAELNEILNNNKLESADYLSKALKTFCSNVSKLRDNTNNFNTWKDIYLTNEFHIKDVRYTFGDNSIFVSGQLDSVRMHPERGIEIVDYKLTKGHNIEHDLLQLAIYAELLKKMKPQYKFNGTLEYYMPELREVVVTQKQLDVIFQNIVLPVIKDLIDIPKDKPDTLPWEKIKNEIISDNLLSFPIGLGVDGQIVFGDFDDPNMCNALVAGSKGSGKSEFLKSMVGSLFKKNSLETLKLSIIDPKIFTFGLLSASPFLTEPVIYEVAKAFVCLEKAVEEMERRCKLLANEGFENLSKRIEAGKNDIPFYVIIFDEFADLILQGNKEKDLFERLISKIASKGSVAGIHLVLSTQRPDRNIVTDIINANLPLKICMRVTSANNSKVILDHIGGESLLGKGDLLCDRGKGIERAQYFHILQDELLTIAINR